MNMQQALSALGTDPKSVYHTLKNLGIRGIPTNPCHCPIAHYLTQCGFVNVVVSGQLVIHTCEGDKWEPLSMAVIQFINNFDDGMYPDLLEQTT